MGWPCRWPQVVAAGYYRYGIQWDILDSFDQARYPALCRTCPGLYNILFFLLGLLHLSDDDCGQELTIWRFGGFWLRAGVNANSQFPMPREADGFSIPLFPPAFLIISNCKWFPP